MIKKRLNKKAVFFSADALVALMIIFLSIAVIYPVLKYSHKDNFMEQDIIESMSSLKIGDMNDTQVKTWIQTGVITDGNKTVLEQIGEFYANASTMYLATNLANIVLRTVDTRENIGIWYEDTLLASRNNTPLNDSSRNVNVERQTLSGIQQGAAVKGYSARAFLSSGVETKYYYFGGYVGDGNISVTLNYTGTLQNVTIEMATNENFTIYKNTVFIGHYSKSNSEFEPRRYYPAPEFNSGDTLMFVGEENKPLYIAGGYIKLVYTDGVQYEQPTTYYFPGIDGLINVYDGFYAPNTITNMEVLLHYNSTHKMYLTIGNVTVFNESSVGPVSIPLNDALIRGKFSGDYNLISNKTIPIRLGLDNVTYTSSVSKPVDVFSVTDVSGSMSDCVEYNNSYTCTYDCNFGSKSCQVGSASLCKNSVCGGSCSNDNNYHSSHDCNKTKLYFAKAADNVFIDYILNNSLNRVGLVAYSSSVNYVALSKNNVSLKNNVSSWNANGGTCICCGINRAVNALNTTSSSDKFQSIVIMSDGKPTYYCNSFNTYTESGGNGQDSGPLEKGWSINASCHAWEVHHIRVYVIGFGDADNDTMQKMAACGNGTYYYSDVENLSEVYANISQDIIEATFKEQTIQYNGDLFTKLYPDSYIKFDFDKIELPYGLVTTSEKKFDDNYTGTFGVPSDAKILETKVVSYSGPRWTKEVSINGTPVYNLTKFGKDYISLGDPYAINVPNSLINQSNLVRLTTGNSSTHTTYGSQYNKIIYTLVKAMVSYSPILALTSGCQWNVSFEDGSTSLMRIPSSATSSCTYNNVSHATCNGGPCDTSNDAIQVATYYLFQSLDYDNNWNLNVKFEEQNLEVNSTEVTGIPYGYETSVQIRKWY